MRFRVVHIMSLAAACVACRCEAAGEPEGRTVSAQRAPGEEGSIANAPSFPLEPIVCQERVRKVISSESEEFWDDVYSLKNEGIRGDYELSGAGEAATMANPRVAKSGDAPSVGGPRFRVAMTDYSFGQHWDEGCRINAILYIYGGGPSYRGVALIPFTFRVVVGQGGRGKRYSAIRALTDDVVSVVHPKSEQPLQKRPEKVSEKAPIKTGKE